MRIAIEHHTTREKARNIVEKRLRDADKQYGQMASDLDWEWHGDTLHVSVNPPPVQESLCGAPGARLTGVLHPAYALVKYPWV